MYLRTHAMIILASVMSWGCGSQDPVDFFNEDMRRLGFIPYPKPLAHAGTGTLIGGSPKEMALVAAPETCFPVGTGSESGEVRKIDSTSLPSRKKSIDFEADARFGLLDIVSRGNPVVSAGAQFNRAQKINLEYASPKVEYLDAIELTRYYREGMPSLCKDYLEHVGFIIEAIKVDQMKFTFYDANGGLIHFQGNNLEDIVDIRINISWRIVNETTLIIDTPKYIAYRLGRLRRSDEGLSLHRASEVADNKFIFKSVGLFPSETEGLVSSFGTQGDGMNPAIDIPESVYIDPHSVYLDEEAK